MTEPLDVQLRIRLAYEAGRNATKAKTDLQEIRAEAQKLGQGVGAGELAKDLEKAGRPAEATRQRIADVARAMQPARREVADLQAHLQKMSGLRIGSALIDEVKALGAAARTTARRVRAIGEAADAVRGISLGARYGNDLEALGRHADEARLKVEHLAAAMRGTGHGPGAPRVPGERGNPFGRARRERGFGDDFAEGADLTSALKYGAIGFAAGRALRMTGEAIRGSAEQAIKFETSMAEVAKAADDLSPEQLRSLRSTIQSLARRTGVGQDRIAASVAQAGYAGRPTADLPAFAELAAKTAPAWGVSSDQAGDTLAKFGNVYHFDQAGIADAANTVDYLGNKTAAKERDIAEYSMRTGPTAQLAGLNFGQNAAVGATMLSQGIEPERASTAVNAILEKLTTRNAKDKEYQAGLRDLHLNARGLIAALKADPGKGLITFFDALSKSKNPLETAVKLFGREHADEASALSKAVGQLATNLGYAADQGARSGSIDKSFQIYSDTTRGKIDKMTASIETLAAAYGRRLEPAIGAVADAIARVTGGLAKGIEADEKVDALAGKVMRHERITPEELDELNKDPDLKKQVDRRAYGKAARTAEGRAALAKGWNGRDYNLPLPLPPETEDREERVRAPEQKRSWWQRLIHRSAYSDDGEMGQAARTGMADYHDELDRGLDRTSRMVHAYAEKMRADLVIKARFDGEVDGLGEGGGIIRASYGGGGSDLGRRSARGGDFGVRSGGGRFNGLAGGRGQAEDASSRHGRTSAPMRYGSGEDASIRYGAKPGRGITEAGRGRVSSWMNFFMRAPEQSGMGLPRGRAAAMVAMMQGESGPNLDPGKEYWDVNGPSGGTAAWHDKNGRGRLSNLKAFAAKLGKPWQDVEVQQQFWKHEAETTQRSAWDAVVNAPTDEEALRQGVRKFEVPADPEGETRKRMPNLARIKRGDFDRDPTVAKRVPDRLPAEVRSPRFQQLDQMRVDAGGGSAGGAGRQQVAMADGPPAIQHFYGGFDEVAVARRSQLESNRQIRRSQARALHDLGRISIA